MGGPLDSDNGMRPEYLPVMPYKLGPDCMIVYDSKQKRWLAFDSAGIYLTRGITMEAINENRRSSIALVLNRIKQYEDALEGLSWLLERVPDNPDYKSKWDIYEGELKFYKFILDTLTK